MLYLEDKDCWKVELQLAKQDSLMQLMFQGVMQNPSLHLKAHTYYPVHLFCIKNDTINIQNPLRKNGFQEAFLEDCKNSHCIKNNAAGVPVATG